MDKFKIISRGLVYFSAIFVMLIELVDTSDCTESQMEQCSKSAFGGSLTTLPGGGQCQAKQYVQYTHLCTVTKYLPIVDYCCCAHEAKVMCCRYHNNWDVFRCIESHDVIDILPVSDSTPPEVLLPAILVPAGVVIICILCVVKCLCCRDDDDDVCRCPKCKDNVKEGTPKVTPKVKRKSGVLHVGHSYETKHNSKAYNESLPKARDIDGISIKMPSAPPAENPEYNQLLNGDLQHGAPKTRIGSEPQKGWLVLLSDTETKRSMPVSVIGGTSTRDHTQWQVKPNQEPVYGDRINSTDLNYPPPPYEYLPSDGISSSS